MDPRGWRRKDDEDGEISVDGTQRNQFAAHGPLRVRGLECYIPPMLASERRGAAADLK